MGAPTLGPITEAMFKREKDGPPALIAEWGRKCRKPGDSICLWAGIIRQGKGSLGWGSYTVGNSWAGLRKTSAAGVERLLAPLAHEGRIQIMQALCSGPQTPSKLAKQTGFKGGVLYHHLKELQHAGYVTAEKRAYRLTTLGLELLIVMSAIAGEVIVDRGEQGLGLGKEWVEKGDGE